MYRRNALENPDVIFLSYRPALALTQCYTWHFLSWPFFLSSFLHVLTVLCFFATHCSRAAQGTPGHFWWCNSSTGGTVTVLVCWAVPVVPVLENVYGPKSHFHSSYTGGGAHCVGRLQCKSRVMFKVLHSPGPHSPVHLLVHAGIQSANHLAESHWLWEHGCWFEDFPNCWSPFCWTEEDSGWFFLHRRPRPLLLSDTARTRRDHLLL